MKQTTVQINEAISIYSDARIARLGTNFPSAATTMRAAVPKGHEGHVMPMSPKLPAAKPQAKNATLPASRTTLR